MYREDEYIRYTGEEVPFAEKQDGMLRLAAGVKHVQVMRANRRHPEWAEGFGHTYNHAPNLVYWKGKFYCHWLSNPVSEHIGLSHTLYAVSADGENWPTPQVLFPAYPLDLSRLPENTPGRDLYTEDTAYACMHQRMGFYIAPDGRLLTLGYYGISPEVASLPCVGHGIGRVVREIYEDGTLGPVYFLLLNHTAGFDRDNVRFPLYTESGDAGFVNACEALLTDKLTMLQMWEENRDCEEPYFAIRGGGEAFNHYRLADGTVVGLWKHGRVSMSHDGGESWLPVKKCHSLVMSGGKIWGEQTAEHQYGLFYNPVTDSCHRWPLAAVTSENGIDFTEMLCVMGEVGPQRYWGFWRDYGPQYIRGLECDSRTADGKVWLTYSMNKEDIWVTSIQAPVTGTVTEHVADDFSALTDPNGAIPNWHLYSPVWARVEVVDHPAPGRKALRLRHSNPADYAKATRIFPESERVRIAFDLEARQNYFGRMTVDLKDKRGLSVFRIILDQDRTLKFKYGNGFAPVGFYGGVMHFEITADCYTKLVNVTVTLWDGRKLEQKDMRFFGNAESLERVEFRAGVRRNEPVYDEDVEFAEPYDLPDADEPLAQESVYYLYTFETRPEKEREV